MKSKIITKLLDLGSKPKSEQFTEEEIKFLKKHLPTNTWKIHYVLYKQKSPKGLYVGLCIDYMANNPRDRTPGHYSMNVICSRDLNAKEKLWEYQNYGTRNRRFVTYWYSDVQSVIMMDMHYGIETPKEFIELCETKGYSRGAQTYIKF